jgi:putative hemolysin
VSSRISLEILLIVLLVTANGVFAMAEIAIVSARKARLRTRAERGDRRAALALELAEKPDDFLSTVQIGITLVGILAGVFGGATIAEELGAYFDTIPWIAPRGEQLSLVLVVIAITYLSLVIGELVPKRIALADPERIAAAMAGPMRHLSSLTRPAVRLLTASTTGIVKLLRLRESDAPAITEEELTSMLELGRKTGEFNPAETEMIKGVFALGDRTARTIMTPRHEVVWLDLTHSAEELRRGIMESGFSRFPVADGSLDSFVGIVELRDLARASFEGRPFDLREAVREALVFPESTSALQILHDFQQRNQEIGIVVDEYGGVEGIVTVSDLAMRVLGIEEGELLVAREDGSWLVDAMMNLDDFCERVGLRLLDAEPDTVAGYVLGHFDRMPRVADYFESGGFRFEVVDMDGRRIDKVLVSRTAADAPPPDSPR